MDDMYDLAELLRGFRIEPDGSRTIVDIRPKKKDPRDDSSIPHTRVY